MGRMEEFGFWLSRTFATTHARRRTWPFVPGTWFVVDPAAPVAVATLGSVALAPEVARDPPAGLCIVGKVETENIGIEKIIRNINSNPNIRFLICAGAEPPKHLTGATMVALFANGVDERRRIIGSPGMRPVLPNASRTEIETFRRRITPVDMIGCTDVAAIHARVAELAATVPAAPPLKPRRPPRAEPVHVRAEGIDPMRIKLDPAGYFVIQPGPEGLLVEHYSNRDELLRTIGGPDARSVYLTLIRRGWVTKLDHAAYLGKELARAELALREGRDFIQDGA